MPLSKTAPILALSLVAPVAAIAAASGDSSPWQIIAQWDNDLFGGSDEGYTNGSRIAFARELPADSNGHYLLEDTLRRLTGASGDGTVADLRFPASGDIRFQYGIGLTQLMFTPEDPYASAPPTGERPYAGWLGLEFSLQASAGDSASTATISVGTTGQLSYAEDIQKWVHQNISSSPVFEGWDSQSPAEATLNVHFDHKQRLDWFDASEDWPIEVDGFYEWGGALGNLRTAAYLGSHLRAGYNLPASYATPRLQLGSFTKTIFERDRAKNGKPSLYGFAGVRAYAVLHDISLDGPLFRDWEESVDSEPWVGELSLGVGAQWHGLELSLAHTLRSDEFKNQTNRSEYGSLMLRLSGNF